MIYKYYHLLWALSFACGLLVYKGNFFIDKFENDINILFILLFSLLIISTLSIIVIYKLTANSGLLLKIILILSTLIFFITGSLRYGLYVNAENKNIFNLIFETFESKRVLYLESLEKQGIITADSYNLDYASVTVEGRIADYPQFYKGNLFFSFEVRTIILPDIGKQTSQKITADINSFDNFKKRGEIKVSDLVSVRVKTKSFQLLNRDEIIRFDGYIKKDENFITLVTEEARVEKISPAYFKEKIFFIRSKFYKCLSGIFSSGLDSSYAGFCKAIILGDTGSLSKNIKQSFIKSGVYHLLAISGLHVSFFIFIISTFLYSTIGICIKDHTKSNLVRFIFLVLIIMFLFFYNFLVGCRASILRSTFMSGLVILANSIKIEYSRKNILSMVFIFTLMINPGMFNDAGFWLSFSAVAAIIYINNIFYKLFDVLYSLYKKKRLLITDYNGTKIGRNYFIEISITTFSVNIFIFPLIAYIFKEFSFLSFFTNVLIIPLFYVLLLLLILFSIVGLFWPPISVFLLKSVNFPIFLILKITGIWKFFNFGVIQIKNFNIIAMTVYYISLLIFLFLISKFVILKLKNKIVV